MADQIWVEKKRLRAFPTEHCNIFTSKLSQYRGKLIRTVSTHNLK